MSKSETGWASVLAGKLRAAESKLWAALGDHGADVITRLDEDESYRTCVADFMIRECATSVRRGTSNLLRYLTTVPVSACGKFAAKDFFTKDNPNVKFWYFSDNFASNFLGKVEDSIPAAELVVHRLERNATDDEIRAELGDRAEIVLAHFYKLLAKQSHGGEGALLVNGWGNIFCVRGAKGNLWTVDAGWHSGDGWFVRADSAAHPGGWGPGCQVFSHK